MGKGWGGGFILKLWSNQFNSRFVVVVVVVVVVCVCVFVCACVLFFFFWGGGGGFFAVFFEFFAVPGKTEIRDFCETVNDSGWVFKLIFFSFSLSQGYEIHIYVGYPWLVGWLSVA